MNADQFRHDHDPERCELTGQIVVFECQDCGGTWETEYDEVSGTRALEGYGRCRECGDDHAPIEVKREKGVYEVVF